MGARFRPVIWQIAEDYAKADLLLRLPGYAPTPAFKEVIDVPLVARHARKTASQVDLPLKPSGAYHRSLNLNLLHGTKQGLGFHSDLMCKMQISLYNALTRQAIHKSRGIGLPISAVVFP